jgi:hypothetical protein
MGKAIKLIIMSLLCAAPAVFSQECKVTTPLFNERYEGECKKEKAHGKGEAWGKYHYKGEFNKGNVTGNGTLYFAPDSTYIGAVQDGLREGKGEMVYKIENKDGAKEDKLVKGYWSGDFYCGKTYRTYKLNNASFSSYDISPSSTSGNVLSFEVSSTTGIPSNGNGIYVASLNIKSADNNKVTKFISKFDSNNTSYTTIQISGFPALLEGKLTNGDAFELHLYKSANWKIHFYLNK